MYRFLIIAILLRRNRTESQTLVLPAELRAEHAAGRNPINRSNSAAVFSPKEKIRAGMTSLRDASKKSRVQWRGSREDPRRRVRIVTVGFELKP